MQKSSGVKLHVAVLVLLCIVISGCTNAGRSGDVDGDGAGNPSDRSADAQRSRESAVVTEKGFTVSLGAITVHGAPGVANAGTEVLLSRVDDSAIERAVTGGIDDIHNLSGVFEISLSDGTQPRVPVEISLQESDAPEGVAFIAAHDIGGTWEGVPVRRDDDKLVVTLGHFSIFSFLDVSGMLQRFAEVISEKPFGIEMAPGCAGKGLSAGEIEYRTMNNSSFLYACLETVDEGSRLSLYNGSPYVWRIRIDPSLGILGPARMRDEAQSFQSYAKTLFAEMASQASDVGAKEVILPPGAYIPVRLSLTDGSARAQFQMDAGLSAVSILGIAVLNLVLAILPGEVSEDVGDLVDVAGCLEKVARTQTATSMEAVVLSTPEIADCFAPIMESLGFDVAKKVGLIIAIVTSLGPAAAKLLMGVAAAIENGGVGTVNVIATDRGLHLVKRARFTPTDDGAINCELDEQGASCVTRRAVYSDPAASCGTDYPEPGGGDELQDGVRLDRASSLTCGGQGSDVADGPDKQTWWDEDYGTAQWRIGPYFDENPSIPNRLAILPDGHALRAGDFECARTDEAVECRNRSTGASFRLDGADQSIKFSGPVSGISENPALPDYSAWDYTE